MPKREVICSQQINCLSCPLSVRLTGKDCKQITYAESDKYIIGFNAINKLNEHLTNIIESDKTSIEISISNEVIKYCYKADNFYDFEHRVYLLSKFIETKIHKELKVHETKKA